MKAIRNTSSALHDRKAAPEASRSASNDRSRSVVSAAYSLIAEKGFEGLRTRDVADKAGINIATLHYYFPSKEELIQGVVEYLIKELSTPRTNTRESAPALERLRAEFADIRVRLRESPEQLVVLTELAMRAWRDPAIAKILEYLDKGWRGHLESIFNAGIAEKSFRPDIDVRATANAMMSQLRGLGYLGKLNPSKLDVLLDQIALQIEYWVVVPSAKSKPRPARNG